MGKKIRPLAFAACLIFLSLAVFGEDAEKEEESATPSTEGENSGAVRQEARAKQPPDFLPSERVKPSVLKPVFEKDRWEVREVEGGLKLEHPKSDRVIGVNWTPEKEVLSFVMWYEFEKLAFKRQKLDLVNRINSQIMLTRASLDEEGDLRFDYWIKYSEGISGSQLLSALRVFEQSTEAALRLQDKQDLVK
ncbi:MAG: YbjN domain-containing protein [bacterium]